METKTSEMTYCTDCVKITLRNPQLRLIIKEKLLNQDRCRLIPLYVEYFCKILFHLCQDIIFFIRFQHNSVIQYSTQIIDSNRTIHELTNVIKSLKNQLQSQSKTTVTWRKKYIAKDHALKNLVKNLSKYLSPEQIEIINGKKNVVWSNECVRKSLLVKIRGGGRVLNYVRQNCIPLPCSSTINRRIKDIDFSTGILYFNLQILKAKCESLDFNEKRFGLVFDEKAIIPGIQKDQTNNVHIGKATIKAPSHKTTDDQLANHGLLFMVTGIDPRIKEIVAYELTGASTCPIEMKTYIFKLICEVENISKIFIDFLSLDMSPCNCSFLNQCGISMTKNNKLFSIVHPNDSNRILYIKPDDVHNIKNQVSGIRKHKIILSKILVEKFDLASSVANFSDIEKIFNGQKQSVYKYAPKLSGTSIAPNHFEVMREENAKNLISSDVSKAIQYLAKNDKKNPTAFLIEQIEKFHSITTSTSGWILDDQESYEDDIKFLKFMAEIFYPNICYQKAYLKSVPGAVMSIRVLIEYSQFLFDIGCKRVIPSRMLSNSIENIFSIITAKTSKPSALDFQHALKAVCISNYEREIVRGSNYEFDENCDLNSIDFLSILQTSKEDGNIENTDSDYDENLMQIVFIPDDINVAELFYNSLETLAFERDMKVLSNKIFLDLDCAVCKSLFFLDDSLSRIISDFYLKLEFLFRKLVETISPNEKIFHDSFLWNVDNLENSFLHCFTSKAIVANKFLLNRIKLSLNCRFVHRANKFASKSISK